MNNAPVTRASLLLRIRDCADTQAWRQFVQLYAPVVFAYARRRRIQEADAADLTQEVLRSVANSVGKFDYDRTRGSFRSWLFAVTRNKLMDLHRRQSFGPSTGGNSVQDLLNQQTAREEVDAWDQEFRKQVFSTAADHVRDEFETFTWQAFWRTAVDGVKPAEVARELNMSVGAVYIAKSRVQARLKEHIHELTEDD